MNWADSGKPSTANSTTPRKPARALTVTAYVAVLILPFAWIVWCGGSTLMMNSPDDSLSVDWLVTAVVDDVSMVEDVRIVVVVA
jgi:hypothetical protein